MIDFEEIMNELIKPKDFRTTKIPQVVVRKIKLGDKAEKNIDKIIFENDCCVIVDTNGNRYISKPEKGEKYDKEKGFLVALAKYNGFTTTRVQDLIKSAVVKNGKKSSRNKKHQKKN